MLLEEVNDYLKITWDDEDQSLTRMIEGAKSYLDSLVGVELDFAKDDDPKTLLLDRCRYVYNNASEYFEESFQREILRLQLRMGVEKMKEDQDGST